MFIAALFTIARIWKKPRCPLTDEWIKMWYTNTMKYYLAIKQSGFESVLVTVYSHSRTVSSRVCLQSEVRKTNIVY